MFGSSDKELNAGNRDAEQVASHSPEIGLFWGGGLTCFLSEEQVHQEVCV